MNCPHCGGNSLEHDSSSDVVVCVQCGSVVEESTIVSESQFQESTTHEFLPPPTGRIHWNKYSSSSSSKAEKAKQCVIEVGQQLGLRSNLIDAASRLLLFAQQHGFLHGRRTEYVAAACLYIACRREGSPHMLLDFADHLHVNVHTLGQVFIRLVRRLRLTDLPLLDPGLLVWRFCAALEFGEKAEIIADTSLRLVGRMKRDWLFTGRRPSGVCAAAILIAARIHGVPLTQRVVVDTLHVGEVTLRTRLNEFRETETSRNTVNVLHDIELEEVEEGDPPAFIKLNPPVTIRVNDDDNDDDNDDSRRVNDDSRRVNDDSRRVNDDDSRRVNDDDSRRVNDDDSRRVNDDNNARGNEYESRWLNEITDGIYRDGNTEESVNDIYGPEEVEARLRILFGEEPEQEDPEKRKRNSNTDISSSVRKRSKKNNPSSAKEAVEKLLRKKKGLAKHISETTLNELFN